MDNLRVVHSSGVIDVTGKGSIILTISIRRFSEHYIFTAVDTNADYKT